MANWVSSPWNRPHLSENSCCFKPAVPLGWNYPKKFFFFRSTRWVNFNSRYMSIKKNIYYLNLYDVVKSREINIFWWFYKLLKSRNSPCNRTQNPAPVVTFWRGRSSLFASNPANSANLARKMICVWKLDELASVEWCSHVSFLVFYSEICPKQTVISMGCRPARAARGFSPPDDEV